MTEILLIQPKIGSWDTIRSEPAPPLSLLSISSLIHDKYKIKIFDQRISHNWKQDLENLVRSNNLVCVGITCMIGKQIYHALEISIFIKKINSEIPIIWGGVQPTLTPFTLIKNKNIDIIVKGEGEITFLELVKCLKLKSDLKSIDGIYFKKNHEIIETKNRKLLDMNDLSRIPYHLVDMKIYMPIFKNKRSFYFQTSRGCPNNCIFCYNIPFNKGYWRGMKAEKVIEELKWIIHNYSVNQFYVVDDNFFVDMKRAEKIITSIIEENLNIHWQIQGVEINSLAKMDENLLLKLEKSGLSRISVGLESGSSEILKFIRKKFTIKQALQLNRKLRNFNIIVFYSIICGLPQETDKELRLSIQLALQILKENPNARIPLFLACTTYPGTDLYDYCYSQGILKKNELRTWVESPYDNMNAAYFSKKRNKFLTKVIFISFFLDDKLMDYEFSRFNYSSKFILKLYTRVARFRMKYFIFNFLIEKFIFDKIAIKFYKSE